MRSGPPSVTTSPGRHDRLDARHPVPRHAVLEGVRPARVAGDVAADLRDLRSTRVGREAQPVLARQPLDVTGGHAGLDVHPPEQRVELPDAIETLEADHDAAFDRDRAAGEAGAPAAGRQRHVVLVAPAQHGGHLGGRRRHDDGVGPADDAAAHQIGEKPALRLEQRVGRDN